MLIADGAAQDPCFSKAINVVPNTADTGIVPSVGSFGDPTCFVGSSSSHVLTNGSSVDSGGMTVEKCVALAGPDGWQFAGVESGG